METTDTQEMPGSPASELFYAKKAIDTTKDQQFFDAQDNRQRKQARTKQRVLNFISIYKTHFNLPKVLTIFENSKEIEKASRKISAVFGVEYNPNPHPNVYLKQDENGEIKLVSAEKARLLFRRSHPNWGTEKELPDVEWYARSNEIIKALVKRVPGLNEGIKKLELEEGKKQLKAR